MKNPSISAAFALSFAVASVAHAGLTVAAPMLTAGTTTQLTSWTGTGGTYTAFATLTPEQQAVELRGAIPEAQANKTLPETVIALPAYRPAAEAMPYGYGTTSVLTAIVRSEACPTSSAAAVGNFSKVWSKSANYGNSTFGSGYLGKFTLGAVAGAGANDKLSAEAYGKADVTVFSLTKGIEAKAYAQVQNTAFSYNAYFKAAGSTLWSPSGTTNLTIAKSWSQTLVNASTLIWIGPVPVTLSASGKGTMGITGSLGYTAAALSATAKPYGNLTASATAAINLVVASAGVTANLTLINAAVPAVASMKLLGSNQFQYTVDVDAQISSLSGNVQAWAKVWYVFGSKKWTTTIASWSGVTATYPIVDVHGCTGKFTL